MPEYDLTGKGAIVTGAGGGINLAFVKSLYNAGCNVVIMDLRLHSDATAWLDSLAKDAPNRVVFFPANVTDWKKLEDVFDVFTREFGGTPDLVCPGAGIYETPKNGFWYDTEHDRRYSLIDVNLTAPIKMCRIAVRRMLKAKTKGVICFISSTGAQGMSFTAPIYAAAKSGITNFVKCMTTLDSIEGTRVVAVAPGVARTPIFLDDPDTLRKLDMEKDFLLEPETVAEAMMLVSFGDKYPPGTVLEVADPDPALWREIEILNDPGPSNEVKARTTSRNWTILEEVKGILASDRDVQEYVR